MEEGIVGSDVKIVSQTHMLGLTRDILEYSHKHQCDAIFAGPRGLTRLQKLFMGSISTKLMKHSGKIPVCIVDGPVRPHKILSQVHRLYTAMGRTDLINSPLGGNQNMRYPYRGEID